MVNPMFKPLHRLLFYLSILTALSTASLGQDRTAQITGIVHDPSGSPIPDAEITVRNVETGVKRQTKTSEKGEYTVTLLDPGRYDILVEHPGFKSFQQTGIILHVNDSVRLDYSLQLGAVTQVINVHEAAPLLRTTDASLGQIIDNQKIVSLPLNGRSSFRLVNLTPGYIGTSAANGQFGDIPVNTTWDSNFSINGGQGYSNEIMIDGTPSTTGFFNQITTMPSVDALVEFKVESNSISAQFGRFGGGVINVITKSGTNTYHGNLYEFVRNDIFGANDFFNNVAGNPKPPFRMNQFGGSLGGPVRIPHIYNGHGKTFFFVNYEATRWRRGAVFTTTVPTPAERNGDFSQDVTSAGKLIVIYNPFSTRINPVQSGAYIRDPFPGNKIPVQYLNPVGINIASYYPNPNTMGSVGGTNNFVSNAGTAINKGQETFRIDHQLTDLQRIFGRGSFDDTDLCQPNYFNNPASPSPGTVGCTTWRNRSATLEYDDTLSATAVFTVRYGFARWYQLRQGLSYGFDQSKLGFPPSIVSQEQVPLFPAISVAGYSGLGNQTQLYLNNGNDTHSLLPSLNLVKGNQTIVVGADVRMTRINFFNPNAPAGQYSFTQAFTQGPNPLTATTTAGDAFASLLLGIPASGSITNDAGVSLQNFYFAGYVQDDIKLTPRLSLSAGLRYETESPYTERHNRLVGFDWNIASPAANSSFPNLHGGLRFASNNDRYVYNWDKNGFAPRLGVAYQIGKKSVIRSGAGIFYAPLQISNNAVGFSPSAGFSSSTPFVSSTNGGLTPFNTLSNPFPSGFVTPTGSSLGAATFLGQTINVWDSHPAMPRSYQWNFDVQQQLPWSVLIDTAYVGNRGVHLAGDREFDTLPDTYLALGANLLTPVRNPFYGQITTGTLGQPTVTAESLLRPLPQFSGLDVINDTAGNSIYHALQIKVEKRLSSGASFLVAYTFGKLISDVPWAVSPIGPNNGSGVYQDWNDIHLERALSAQDVSQSFTLSFDYELPFGKGKLVGASWKGPAQWFLGGWDLNGIVKLNSGTPLALSTAVNNTYSLGGGSRPNTSGQNAALPGGRPDGTKIQEWFDIATFSQPPPFTFGNVSRTLPNVRSPGVEDCDVSLFKNIAIHENVTLQFRAEFFNVFNHPNFAPPDTTYGDKTFGQINSLALLPRVGQLALKLNF